MFFLAPLQDTLATAPKDLQRAHLEAVTAGIRTAYFDKVVKDLGLCITLYDVQKIDGGFVFPGDGAPRFTDFLSFIRRNAGVWEQVDFRLLMFRPFVGEVLQGKLSGCDATGLHVSLGFFGDIHIPEHLLQAPSEFDPEEKLWVWKFNGNDMFMDLDEPIRFKVAQLDFPALPVEQEKGVPPFAPMRIVGDINADGLGLVQWWA